MTDQARAASFSRNRMIAYWVITALVATEAVAGGVSDLLRLPYVVEILRHLGYPAYFPFILGVWKLFGAVAVVVPRYPRLKEWAYAGMFFNYTGAVASHLAVGDSVGALLPPIIFASLVVASWALRPLARRL